MRELDDRGACTFSRSTLVRGNITKKVMLFSSRTCFLLIVSQKYFCHVYVENSDLKSLLSFGSWVCCGARTSVDRENVQVPLSSSSRVLFVQFMSVLKLATGCLVMEFLRSGLHQNLRVELFNFSFQSLPHYRLFVWYS